MLTYHLQTRALVIPSGKELIFPNKVHVKVTMSPRVAFGTEDVPSRTLVRAHAASILLNANTGRWVGQSKPPLEPLEVIVKFKDSELQLKGNILTYDFDCDSPSTLESMITALKFIYPTILNLEFSDPPVVESISGKVGDTDFRWEHIRSEWMVNMRTIEQDVLEKYIADSFEKLQLFNGIENRRLAAALSYFHIAVRLNVCGDSPWEFMAETILNYCKAIEILLVTSENSKDDIRRELESLGYSDEEIEGDFIPLTILRSFVNVAHPRVALFKRHDLRVLYKYLARSEFIIREFLLRVLKKISNSEYSIPQDENLELKPDDRKGMDKLVKKMESRIVEFKQNAG
jgi:hypothetical protein